MAPGATITTTLTAQIDDGWYIYAVSQKPGGPIPMHVALPKKAPSPFALGAVTTSTPAKRKFDPNFQMETEVHEESATYDVKTSLPASASVGKHTLRVVVTFQTCNERLCLPPKDEELTQRSPWRQVPTPEGRRRRSDASAFSGESIFYSCASGRHLGPSTLSHRAPQGPGSAVVSRPPRSQHFCPLAALMGALSLLTPCVFPMVPITVSYFTNRRADGAGATR